MFMYWNWSLLDVYGCHQRSSNMKLFLFTETGFQVSAISILHPFHMLIHWSICGHQGSEDQTIDSGWTWRSLAKDISHVVCVLHQHSAGECELTFHSSFVYANNKVIYSCNHRSGPEIININKLFFYVSWSSVFFCCHAIILSYLQWLDSCFTVASLEKIFWLANLGFFGTNCWRNPSNISYWA